MTAIAPLPPDALSLALLQSTRTYPAISVLAGTEGAPSGTQVRLAALVAEADARLRAEPDLEDAGALVAALRELADTTPLDTGAAALALFVSRGSATAVPLPIGVRDRVVIDETFATRDLVHARARSLRYRVLTLGDGVSRLYEGLGPVLEQVHGGGFPLALPLRDEPERQDRAHERGGRRDELLRRMVQAVDAAVAPHLRGDPSPLVVVGADRRVAALRTASRHRDMVSAAVVRPADRLTLAELAGLVRPQLDGMLAARREEALRELDEARGAKRYAAGILEAWPLAAHGRVALLVVEEGFAYPARVDPITSAVEPAEDVTAPDVVDDLVDEAIEAVLATRGRVVIVPDGTLGDAGHIALSIRW